MSDYIAPQYVVNELWNPLMLAWLIAGKETVMAQLRAMDNPLAEDMLVRLELTDTPYFLKLPKRRRPSSMC